MVNSFVIQCIVPCVVWIRNIDHQEVDFKRLEAFEMWVWLRMEKVIWTEHKTNKEVMYDVAEGRSLMATIRERQRKCIGYLLRNDSLLRTIMDGKRTRRVPRPVVHNLFGQGPLNNFLNPSAAKQVWRLSLVRLMHAKIYEDDMQSKTPISKHKGL